MGVDVCVCGRQEDICDRLWAKAVKLVPERVMKFALNAVSDTRTPFVNSDLKKWKKLSDDQCPLCQE